MFRFLGLPSGKAKFRTCSKFDMRLPRRLTRLPSGEDENVTTINPDRTQRSAQCRADARLEALPASQNPAGLHRS